jgi:membrane protein required for colicin V production
VSIADWLIVFFILVSALQAAWQGFFQTAFGIAGLIAGYLLAAWQYPRVSGWFAPHVRSPWVGDLLGFIIIFLAAVFVAALLGRLAGWLMKKAGLSGFDRFLGAILGLIRGGLFVAVLLMGMAAFAPSAKWLQDSQLAPYFLVVGRAAIWTAPSDLRARFYQGLDFLRDAEGTRSMQAKPARR